MSKDYLVKEKSSLNVFRLRYELDMRHESDSCTKLHIGWWDFILVQIEFVGFNELPVYCCCLLNEKDQKKSKCRYGDCFHELID